MRGYILEHFKSANPEIVNFTVTSPTGERCGLLKIPAKDADAFNYEWHGTIRTRYQNGSYTDRDNALGYYKMEAILDKVGDLARDSSCCAMYPGSYEPEVKETK